MVNTSDLGVGRVIVQNAGVKVVNGVYTRDGPTLKLPNNATINATKTGIIPLSGSLSTHAKRAHIFDGLYSASRISLGLLYYEDCVAILDKN